MKFSARDIQSGVTVAICSVIYGLLTATPALSSLLFVASMSRFNIDREHAAFPFVLCYTTRNAFGPVIGFLGNRFGLKKIILIGSVFSAVTVGACFFAKDTVTILIFWGVAFGFSFGLGVALLPQLLRMHFSKHLDKAIGIYIGGECIIAFLLTLLTHYLLKSYGLSGTFLILSCVILHSVPAAMLIIIPKNADIPVPIKEKLVPKAESDIYEVLSYNVEVERESNRSEFDRQKTTVTPTLLTCRLDKSLGKKLPVSIFKVFLDPAYILILITQGAMMYIYTMINIILVDVSVDHGVSATEVVYILAGFQITDAIGRFTLGFITDYGCLSKANFLASCFAAIGLILLTSFWVKGFSAMMVFVLGVGIFKGGLVMISPSVVMNYIDKEFHSMAIASRCFLYPPVSFTQAPLIGYFRDTLRSYDGLICILVGICCASSIISFLIPRFVKLRERRKDLPFSTE